MGSDGGRCIEQDRVQRRRTLLLAVFSLFVRSLLLILSVYIHHI
jgi:hypothetical protein